MKSEKRDLMMLFKLVSMNSGALLVYFLGAGYLEHRFQLHGVGFFAAMVLTLITCFYVLFKIAFKNTTEDAAE